MANSKVIYGGRTLIDLTGDTVTADKMLKGYTAHGANGELVEGTCTYDSNTQDANAAAAEMLSGKIAYVKGQRRTGTMANNGGVSGTIDTKEGSYTVPKGYHDGSGKVSLDSTEKEKLIASNIRENVTILGVTGTMSGSEGVKAQSKDITPSSAEQTILPDSSGGYNYLSQVKVKAIPYSEEQDSAGGTIVTIG